MMERLHQETAVLATSTGVNGKFHCHQWTETTLCLSKTLLKIPCLCSADDILSLLFRESRTCFLLPPFNLFPR